MQTPVLTSAPSSGSVGTGDDRCLQHNMRYLGFEGSPRDPGKDRSIFERTVDSRLQSWQDVTDIKNDPWIIHVSPICNMQDSLNQTFAVFILFC